MDGGVRRVGCLRRRSGAGLLTLAVTGLVSLVGAPGASANAVPELFAGTWSTSVGPPNEQPGALTLRSTDDASGIAAIARVAGGPNNVPSGCTAQTRYYVGNYSSGSGSHVGEVAGCTGASGEELFGYYGPATPHGSFDIKTSCAALGSFTGTWADRFGLSQGAYEGIRTIGTPDCS